MNITLPTKGSGSNRSVAQRVQSAAGAADCQYVFQCDCDTENYILKMQVMLHHPLLYSSLEKI